MLIEPKRHLTLKNVILPCPGNIQYSSKFPVYTLVGNVQEIQIYTIHFLDEHFSSSGLLSLGLIPDPCFPCSAFHGSHCLSLEFTGSAKFATVKQTG